MPAPTPGYVKNMIRRSLREIVDPSPTKEDKERIWKFFANKCAYCGKPLRKLLTASASTHMIYLDKTNNEDGMIRKKLVGITVACVIAIIVLVVIATRPPATSIPQPPAGFAMYNDIVSGFAIVYPEDWEMIPKHDIDFALVGFWDRRQGATMNSFYVMKASLPYAMDVDDYFESEEGYFPGEYANYTPISTDTLTLNGRKAIRHTWTFTAGSDTYEYIRQYIVDREIIWVLEAGCALESFDSYQSVYNTMMSGFYILS